MKKLTLEDIKKEWSTEDKQDTYAIVTPIYKKGSPLASFSYEYFRIRGLGSSKNNFERELLLAGHGSGDGKYFRKDFLNEKEFLATYKWLGNTKSNDTPKDCRLLLSLLN